MSSRSAERKAFGKQLPLPPVRVHLCARAWTAVLKLYTALHIMYLSLACISTYRVSELGYNAM